MSPRRLILALASLLLGSIVVAPPASAEVVECPGVLTGPIDANVVVPSGTTCLIVAAQVDGNVFVESAASLQARNSLIDGNVIGHDSRSVILNFQTEVTRNFHVRGGAVGTITGFDIRTRVGGNAKIEQNAGRTFVDAASVGGNLLIYDNTGFLEIEFNTIEGSVHVKNNVPVGMSNIFNTVGHSMIVSNNSGPSTKIVAANTVAQSLVCQNNDPPFVGAPNVASNYQGQCGMTP